MAFNQGFEYREQIDRRGGGLTALEYLTLRYRHSSEEEWRYRLHDGQLSLDGRSARQEDVLKAGQMLVWRRPPWDEPDVPLTFEHLYDDSDILAVSKPSGLPSVPGGGFLEHTLLALVRREYPEATPIHRLGRGTSGVVLFARTARARSGLCQAWRRNEVTKIYRALASGNPARNHFAIDMPIGPVPHPLLGTVHAACPMGRQASSQVTVLERRTGACLLEVRIETGRPHQIRIHLASVGHPLIDDPLYVSGGGIRESEAVLPGECGYLLHAQRLSFQHPATGQSFEISCCSPPELLTALEPNQRNL